MLTECINASVGVKNILASDRLMQRPQSHSKPGTRCERRAGSHCRGDFGCHGADFVKRSASGSIPGQRLSAGTFRVQWWRYHSDLRRQTSREIDEDMCAAACVLLIQMCVCVWPTGQCPQCHNLLSFLSKRSWPPDAPPWHFITSPYRRVSNSFCCVHHS